MVRIDKMTVSNFKNVSLADVTFGSLNVLVGPNGSGKSNFMMITSFLDSIVYGGSESVKVLLKNGYGTRFGNFYTQQSRKDRDARLAAPPIEIGISFSDTTLNYSYNYNIKIDLENAGINKEKNFMIYSESLLYKSKSSPGKYISIMQQKDGLMTINKVISNNFISTKMTDNHTSGVKILDVLLRTNPQLNKDYGHVLNALNTVLKTKVVYLSSQALKYYDSDSGGSSEGRLVKFNLEEQIKEIHKTDKWSIFIDAVKSVTKIDNIIVVDSDKKQDQLVREDSFVAYLYKNRICFLSELSDGEILLIGLITQIITSNQDIIFFEEIENSVHPKALENLIQLININHDDKQVLISTHSATLLNMVKPENVFVAVIDDEDCSEITMIPDVKEMKKKLSKGFINFGDLLYQGDANKFEDIFE